MAIQPPQKYQFTNPDGHPSYYEPHPFPQKEDYYYAEFKQLNDRIISHQRLIEHLNTNIWDDQHDYQIITVENIKSPFLDSNDEFQSMVSMIQMFNSEVLDAKKRKAKIRNGVWRNKFFQALSRIVQEIQFFTKNRELQNDFISKCHQWAVDTITKVDFQSRKADSDSAPKQQRPISSKRPFSSSKRPLSGITTKSMRPQSGYPATIIDGYAETTVDNNDRPESAITGGGGVKIQDFLKESQASCNRGKLLPSEIISDKLQDYRSGARTKHDGYEEPEQRLKKFKRRQIQLIAPRPKTAFSQGNQNVKSAFPKPKSAQQQQQQQQQEQAEVELELEEEEVENGENEALRLIQEEENKKKQNILEPGIKVFKIDDQLLDNFKRNLDQEKKDNYQYYNTSDNKDELNAQLRYQKLRNKEAAIKREDEEMVNMMGQWSQNKARMEREINRRIESATIGNKFKDMEMKQKQDTENDRKDLDKIYQKHMERMQGLPEDDGLSDLSEEYQEEEEQNDIEVDDQTGGIGETNSQGDIYKRKRPQTSQVLRNHLVDFENKLPQTNQYEMKFMNNTDFRGLEEQIRKKHVDQVKKLQGQVIGLQPEEDESNKLAPEHSMSIYGKQQQFLKPLRPFSAAIALTPLDKIRQEQIDEIQAIRIRLAKNNDYTNSNNEQDPNKRKDVQIPMSKLIKALMIPDCYNLSDPVGINLPKPGAGFLVNPHEKKKKKKKGKGKKKKTK